jgi:transposase-like protein
VTKDGTTQLGGQRFRCSQCGRRFTRRSSSAFSGRGFPDDIIALAVRWYVRYRLSYAEVNEWLAERGVLVDQSTIHLSLCTTRDLAAAHTFFEREIAFSGTTPRPVITDKAATYPPALVAAAPGILHTTGRYRTNGIERDHGFVKERLRPMRGLKSVASAAIFMRGHALMRNIRRGFYPIVPSVPQRLVFAWTWTRLTEAV